MSAYNAARFLPEALTSILRQTFTNFELILIDNGSVDDTFAVARSLADARVRLLRVDENLGGYQAMNRVAAMSRGEFVAVYHADDVYDPRIVEQEVAFLQAHPEAGAVFTLDHNIDEESRIFATVPMPDAFVGRTLLDYDTVLRYQVRRGCPFCCPTFMTRRSVLETVGYFQPETWGIASDAEMWLRIAQRFPLAILDAPLISYRKGNHQWSHRYRSLRTDRDRFFDVIDHYLDERGGRARLSDEDLAEYVGRQCDDETFRAVNFVLSGDVTSARTLLRSRRFPWRVLRQAEGRRRKIRLLVLRSVMTVGLAVGATAPLAWWLKRIGP